MAKVLFITQSGELYSLARGLVKEGHSVSFYSRDSSSYTGEKNLKIYPSLKELDDPDLILTGGGVGRLGDRVRKTGAVVLGGGAFGDTLETTSLGVRLAKLQNLKVDLPSEENILLGVTAIFNGVEFMEPFIISTPCNRLMEGDRGPLILDGVGQVLWTTNSCMLTEGIFNQTLKELLYKVRYTGPITAYLRVTENNIHFVRWACGLKEDFIQTLGELFKEPWFDLFHRVATRMSSTLPLYRGRYALSVRLSIYPYPLKGQIQDSVPIAQVENGVGDHLWLSNVSFLQDGTSVVPTGGLIGCVTAWGETIREAQRRVYRTIGKTIISDDVQYRRDIGEGIESYKRVLTQWGWING